MWVQSNYLIYITRQIFGTPQVRERLVIVGNNIEKLPYLSPTHSEHGNYGLKSWNTFKSAVKGLHNINHDFVKFPEYRIRYYKKIKEGQNWKSLPVSLQKEALGVSFLFLQVGVRLDF